MKMKKSIIFKGSINQVMSQIENTMLRNYKNVVNELMRNDKNATYDEILKDNNYNLQDAYKELRECIQNAMDDFSQNDEEYKFYKEQLETL